MTLSSPGPASHDHTEMPEVARGKECDFSSKGYFIIKKGTNKKPREPFYKQINADTRNFKGINL